MTRSYQRLHPAVINLIHEGSVFKQDVADYTIERQRIDEASLRSPETASQTTYGKIKGNISRLALGDTVEQPEN